MHNIIHFQVSSPPLTVFVTQHARLLHPSEVHRDCWIFVLHFDQDVSELVNQLQQSGSSDVLMVHNLLKVVLSPKIFTQAGKPLEQQKVVKWQKKVSAHLRSSSGFEAAGTFMMTALSAGENPDSICRKENINPSSSNLLSN